MGTDRQTDGQTDRRTDRRTDGQTQVTTITLRPKRPRVNELYKNVPFAWDLHKLWCWGKTYCWLRTCLCNPQSIKCWYGKGLIGRRVVYLEGSINSIALGWCGCNIKTVFSTSLYRREAWTFIILIYPTPLAAFFTFFNTVRVRS